MTFFLLPKKTELFIHMLFDRSLNGAGAALHPSDCRDVHISVQTHCTGL